jgi:hypothetical protein
MLNVRANLICASIDFHKILFYLLLMLAVPFSIFSVYKLYTGITPTLYMLLFCYLIFFILGLVYFYNTSKNYKNKNYSIKLIDNSYGISLQKLACALFFLLSAAMLVSLDNRIYTNDLLYYLLVSIVSSFLGLQIIALSDAHIYFQKIIFLQILIFGIIIRSSSFMINPYLMGADTYWHYNVIEDFILSQGHLDLYAQNYFYFPSYHLSQAAGELLMGQGEFAFNLINLSHSVILILISYLIGRSLNGEKTGLICALIFSVATPLLSLLISNTSKIGGITLALLCIYLTISIYKRYNAKLFALLILVVFPTALWHPELLFFLVSLGCANIAVLIYKSNFKFNFSIKFLITLFLCCIMLAFYYFFSYFNFSDINRALPQLVSIIPSKNINIKFLLQLFLAYFAVTFPIFFIPHYLVDKRNQINYCILVLLSTLIILHILPFLSIISGIFALNPERLFNYIQIILLILMANSILTIFKIKKLNHAILFIIIFSLFSFSSASSYLIGDGNDVFNDAIQKGTTYLSFSNLVVHDFLSKTDHNVTISSDYETMRYISDPVRGIYYLDKSNIVYFPFIEKGYLLLNLVNLRRLNWESTDWGRPIIDYRSMNNIYDNKQIKIIYY